MSKVICYLGAPICAHHQSAWIYFNLPVNSVTYKLTFGVLTAWFTSPITARIYGNPQHISETRVRNI